jgi:CheY-like chemotaxis protein
MQSEQPEDSTMAKKPPERNPPARMGGARADFVASLGRKVNDARAALDALDASRGSPAEKAPREDLRRRLHALGASARLLRFDAMGTKLADAERALDEVVLDDATLGSVRALLGDLPALAWDEGPGTRETDTADATEAAEVGREPGPPDDLATAQELVAPEDGRDDDVEVTVKASETPELRGEPRAADVSRESLASRTPSGAFATRVSPPRTALVVGPASLEAALATRGPSSSREVVFEQERTDDAQLAIDLARRTAPDVLLLDADVDAAAELVEALLDDPLTEPTPVVVVGTFREQEQAARFIALGVSRTLTKPIAPEAIRRACNEAIERKKGRSARVALGEPTLEQLGDRLADEVRRALVDGADGAARSCLVPLGEGAEVMSAMWGAIARVRELVTARTNGAVRFGRGPEGAVTLAPWLQPDLAGTHRATALASLGARGRGPAADVPLHGRRVVVADDDPGVTWFIADVLRGAGCVVHEALDGAAALELCYRVSPELVVSDILMPELDGFALARTLRRDVALRDTPVILLSWKEDLLQRVRELGASAAAYMRKESDSQSILARVREVLRPRARVEARLKASGDVHGRLDGLTVRSLLALVCELRPAARVTIRDASCLYEIELEGGAPRRATRTSADGTIQRGERVLSAVLGVGAGRFRVEAGAGNLRVATDDPALAGTLAEQLARPLAMARAAMGATLGARTLHVDHVTIDEAAIAGYVTATPGPAREIVEALLTGASPRALLLGAHVDPMLLEDVLVDLAARGAVVGVRGTRGDDLLAGAFDALLAARPAPPSMRVKLPASVRTRAARVDTETLGDELPAIIAARSPASGRAPVAEVAPATPSSTSLKASPSSRASELPPSSLADAVMRELSDHSPEIRERSSTPPPIVEPSELRMRSSSPPADPDRELPSLPPDAIVPGNALGAIPGETPPPPSTGEPMVGDAEPRSERTPLTALDRTDLDAPVARYEHSVPVLFDDSAPLTPPSRVAPVRRARPAGEGEDDEPARTPLASVRARPAEPEAPRPRARYAVFGAAIVLLALVTYKLWIPSDPAVTAREGSVESPSAVTPAPFSTGVPVVSAPSGVTYGEIPAGLETLPGQGMLDLVTAADVAVRVDGVARGSGPRLRVPLSAGPHEVQLEPKKTADDHAPTSRVIEVRAGRTASIDLSTP